MHVARRLARRFAGRGQPFEDLEQVARLGLVKAAHRFDRERGVTFEAYAQTVMLGELRRFFRDYAWRLRVARPIQTRYLEIRSAVESLSHELSRPPTTRDIADRLGMDEEMVIEALDAGQAFHMDSLDVPPEGGWTGEPAETEPGFVQVEERAWLLDAIRKLPPREQMLLRLRFDESLTQSAIAERVGLSQMHVSRLLSRSLSELRRCADD